MHRQMGPNVGVQWMMSKFGSSSNSKICCLFKLFLYADSEEQCPITETLKHIFGCSRRFAAALCFYFSPLCLFALSLPIDPPEPELPASETG